jgi:hypothetical protein
MYTSSYWQVKNNYLGIQSEATGSFASAIAVLELLHSTFDSEGTCLSMMLLGLVSSARRAPCDFASAELF